jgi:hypothetical protein
VSVKEINLPMLHANIDTVLVNAKDTAAEIIGHPKPVQELSTADLTTRSLNLFDVAGKHA